MNKKEQEELNTKVKNQIINGCLLILIGLCCIYIHTQDKHIKMLKQINQESVENFEYVAKQCDVLIEENTSLRKKVVINNEE